ncbi:MAG: O-antigen ligase family protein [Gammaproteobacteria bacterium]|nr:O-antigen ligase family protein [Gammaproteobacteria bacterium]
MGGRANAIFITPNTFAASVNAILLPLIVIYLISKDRKYLLPVLLFIFSALLVTKSRGGWLAFLSSIIFILILIKIVVVKLEKKKLKKLIAGLMIVFAGYSAVDLSGYDRINNKLLFDKEFGHVIRFSGSDAFVSGMSARFQLFDIAWQQIKLKPIMGYGLHTYKYYKKRDQQPPFYNSRGRFAHNDYLQIWMETGFFGVMLFVSIFVVPIFLLMKFKKIMRENEKIYMISIIAGLASLYAHALVDFIFYVPFLIFAMASGLGLINQIINRSVQLEYSVNFSNKIMRTGIFKCLAGVIMIWTLSQPVIAQSSYNIAKKRMNRLDIKGAFSCLEIARRFAPYEAGYYWYEGALLMNAVRTEQHKQSAKRADEIFSMGMQVDSFAARNKLARIQLHRDYGHLLEKREELAVLLSWNKEALHWHPHDPLIQSEFLKTLLAMGAYAKAKSLLDIYILQSPESKELLKLKVLLRENG